MSKSIQVSELVNALLRGARVVDATATQPDDVVTVRTKTGQILSLDLSDLAFDVERVAPAERPPLPGDLWRDRDGDLLMYQQYLDRYSHKAYRFVAAADDQVWSDGSADSTLYQRGPLSLVFREGWTPAPALTEPKLDTDKRAAIAAALDEIAGLFRDPRMPVPIGRPFLRVTLDGDDFGDPEGALAKMHAFSSLVGGEIRPGTPYGPGPQEGRRHWHAEASFGPIELTAGCVGPLDDPAGADTEPAAEDGDGDE